MSDYQFPTSAKSVVMTSAAILEWLEGEIEGVHAMKETRKKPIERAVFAAIADYVQGMSDRFAATAMRGLDGDEKAACRAPKGQP